MVSRVTQDVYSAAMLKSMHLGHAMGSYGRARCNASTVPGTVEKSACASHIFGRKLDRIRRGLPQARISRIFFRNLGGSDFRPQFREIWGGGAKCEYLPNFAKYFAFDIDCNKTLKADKSYLLLST